LGEGYSAFNVPFQLTIGPLVGAIAAGNTVVVKPSETSPHCAAVLQDIIEAGLDPSVVRVVQGGVPQVQALLAERWDKICFTGSATVGRIVAKAAAPNLTPVLLELGGRNPAFITKKADLRLAARRLLWGKTFNAGQICLSQNYILADKEVVDGLVAEFRKAYAEYYPNGVKESPDFCRIVNDGAFRRIKSLIDNSKGKILLGGTMDEKERFIEPTIVQVDSVDDSLMTSETFGPVITILPVNNLDEAIQIANDIDSTPLAVYPFGTKQEVEKGAKIPSFFNSHFFANSFLYFQSLEPSGLAAPLSTIPSCTPQCLHCHSAASARAVPAATTAAAVSKPSSTAVQLSPRPAGLRRCFRRGTLPMRASCHRSSSRALRSQISTARDGRPAVLWDGLSFCSPLAADLVSRVLSELRL
jgi:hypothetical protein